ncbi:8522_t:CDS:2, partial [Dentiscutata erythropus]
MNKKNKRNKTNSDLYSIYQIQKELTWEVQKNDILTKLLPPLKRKINKKYKVTSADIVQMLQRCHRSQHHEYNIETKGEDFVKRNSRRATKNTAMSNGGDKYIKRYPKKDLEKILNDTGYHSEEWEETDDEELMTTTTTTLLSSSAVARTTSSLSSSEARPTIIDSDYDIVIRICKKQNKPRIRNIVSKIHREINPPKGAPSWTLSEEALISENRDK